MVIKKMIKLCISYQKNVLGVFLSHKNVEKYEKSTAPGIPRRSPIQVLTGLDVA